MEPVKLDDLHWKSLANSIRNERCVLFIGPMLATMREVYTEDREKRIVPVPVATPAEQRAWSPVYIQLALHLATTLAQYGVSYDSKYQTDLEYVAQRYLKIPFMDEIDLKETAGDFIRLHTREVPRVYHLIAELPVKFPLIVNTAPDTFLHQIFDNRHHHHQFEWYNYERARDPEIVDFSKNHPLIYNLVGKVGDSKSLVLTEGQQLTFVKKIIQNDPKVPDKIVNKLNPQNEIVYLFVGFNFERWQFRMLLDRLNISEQSKTIAPRHPWIYQERRTAEFYNSRFNFLFVEDHVEQFLQSLHDRIDEQPGAQNNLPGLVVPNDDIPQLYVSFHDNDKAICDKLLLMLKLMEKNRMIRVWHREMTRPGDMLAQITEQLQRSRFLIPLLSLDYVGADNEVLQTEAGFAFSDNWTADKGLIPVLASDCPLDDTDFANKTVLPRIGKPLNDNSWGGDQGYKQVYEELKALLQLSSNQRNP